MQNTETHLGWYGDRTLMKQVVITGADGFIGTHFIQRLLQDGVEIWAIVYPQSSTKDRLKDFKKIHCVESTLDSLTDYIDIFPQNTDAFYHFAWQGVNAFDRNDMPTQMKNIDMCLYAIRFAANIHTKKFILPGSTSEYLHYGKPIDENALPSPQNAYGSVKVALRYLAQQYALQCGLDFIYTVITGIYAADRKDNNVIYYTIDKLLHGEKPSVTKLEQRWDYVHIDDVTEALTLIGEKGKAGAFYVVGHGDNQPLYEYIKVIHQYINPSLPLGIGDIPYADDRLPSSCVDLTNLQIDTGFIPKVGFDTGIKAVIETMRREISNEK